jgi:hypothetical protein
MHLAVGLWIWQHGSVPLTDPFGYVTAGQPFIAHSWLAEVLFYLVEQHAGTMGFMLLRFALISGALFYALQTARLLKAPWPALTLLAPVVLVILWGRLEFRPQLFTTAFLAGELWLLISVHTGQRSGRWLWALPPLYALWINLHAGWPQGLLMLVAILGALMAMQVRQTYAKSAATSHFKRSHLMLVLVACVGALFLNPYGTRLVAFPLEMQQGWIRAMGPEWQSPVTSPGWRAVGGGRVVPLAPVFWVYLALLIGALWRRLVMSCWLVLALWHLRAVSDAVLLTSPLLAAALPWAWWRGQPWPMLLGSTLTVALMVMALSATVSIWRTPRGFHVWSRGEPVCVLARLEQWGLSGRLYMRGNARTDHSWLLYRLHPHVQVPSTWEYVAGETTMAALKGWDQGPDELLAHVEAYQVQTLVLSTARSWPGVPTLERQGWVVVHVEDHWLIMVRQEAAKPASVYHHIRPWASTTMITPAIARAVLDEATRALDQCPGSATFAWAWKAQALQVLGQYQGAFDAGLHIPERLRLE